MYVYRAVILQDSDEKLFVLLRTVGDWIETHPTIDIEGIQFEYTDKWNVKIITNANLLG